jgi:hypothetical protein
MPTALGTKPKNNLAHEGRENSDRNPERIEQKKMKEKG